MVKPNIFHIHHLTISSSHQNMNKLCVGVCFTTWSWWRSLGFETINVAKTNTSWEHCSSVWSPFFIHDHSFQHLICFLKPNLHVPSFLFNLLYSTTNTINTSRGSYLPPFKGFIREDAVLPGHERMDGLIEALSKPWVILQLNHALSTGAQPFGEKVVRQVKSVLEKVERGVPESVTEQERCERNGAKQKSKSPDFPPLE